MAAAMPKTTPLASFIADFIASLAEVSLLS
ncbi:hypothetical protein DE4585_03895 [Mycobacteroides salmoniphilum]|uniref:Uncharacterized protein n=1 Tax=Mycobacteroides salmoniphilum TaxID=404941 RepID=A0A4R8S514_9MYCO|nr:hypothetical protein DE4585_03895 [Mycobacteroides salmoniphilum]